MGRNGTMTRHPGNKFCAQRHLAAAPDKMLTLRPPGFGKSAHVDAN
jgi:hypothetical protein